jgi:hypothetical protein
MVGSYISYQRREWVVVGIFRGENAEEYLVLQPSSQPLGTEPLDPSGDRLRNKFRDKKPA